MPMNLSEIRLDFPILTPQGKEKQIVYLDSACQSLRPRQVIDAITCYYVKFPACSGRSNHQLATAVAQKVDDVREQVARFIGASHKEEIVFSRNTTEGINLIANSLDFKTGDVVLVGGKEHNSNLIPWQVVAKKCGVQLKIQVPLADGTFDLTAFEQNLKSGVRLVAFGQTSNLDGVSLPVEQIIKLAHKSGALVLLDAAQSAPQRKINVRSLDVDFLAFSGHKILGPSGTGVLYGKAKLLDGLTPFLVGGDTVASSTYETAEFLPVPE